MKNKNWTLVIGLLLLALLLLSLIFPEWISSKNPYALSFIKFWQGQNGELKIATAPYPPGDLNPIGTDQMGRDLLSFLLYGSRLTLLLALGVALTRFVLAIPLGIAAGMNRVLPSRIIDRFNLVLTTIPPLLIAILVLRMDFFASLYRSQSTALFILTLSLIGWSKIASILTKSTGQIMAETYILAERAIGKSPLQIAKSHVLPHLLPEIVILFFMEIASVLTLMMQLGLFSVFVGNLKIIKDSAREGFSYFNVTFEPEWSSLLGSARDYIRVAPWIALSAGLMFFLTVFAFNLIGEGLRQEFQRKNHSMVTALKNSFKKEHLVIFCLIITAILYLKWPDTYTFNEPYNAQTLSENNVIGVRESEQALNAIQAHMIQLGIEPAGKDGQYLQSFESSPGLELQFVSLALDGNELSLGEDYVLLKGKSLEGTYKVIDGTENFYALQSEQVKGKLVYVDTAFIRPESVHYQLEFLNQLGAKGVIMSGGLVKNAPRFNDLVLLSVSEEIKSQLSESLASHSMRIDLKINASMVSGTRHNIFGKIVGKEETMAQNTLIIGMDLQAVSPEKRREKLAFYLNMLSNLASHSDQINRTILFAFFDGPEGLEYYSEHTVVQNKHVNLFLDLTELDGEGYDRIAFSDELAPISRYYGFIFAQQYGKNAKSISSVKRAELNLEDRLLYLSEGLTTLNFKTNGSGSKKLSAFGEIFIKTLIENTY